uniref:Uncharacterized protein n=1 Tax=Ditylenchus dipsaci TaxID=166011 RepID=A0A915DW35_9BILA
MPEVNSSRSGNSLMDSKSSIICGSKLVLPNIPSNGFAKAVAGSPFWLTNNGICSTYFVLPLMNSFSLDNL